MLFLPHISESHQRITDLGMAYADEMAEGRRKKRFSRGALAVAHMMGGEKILRLVCNIIKESISCGLNPEHARNLLISIEAIAQMPLSDRPDSQQ